MLNCSQEVIKIVDSSVTQVKRRWRSPGVFYLFITIGLIAAVGLSFGLNVLAPRMQRDAPERLGNLELIGTIEGSEAMAQVNRLHGTDIELVSAYIAEYAQGNERGTVWVGKAESKEDAAELNDRMIRVIGKGSSGFSNLQRISIVNHEVFQIDGPGGQHFFFISRNTGKDVVWLIVTANDILPIVEQALKNF